jgi:uncharacterized secreted protein with C-terminal beta-propeller domain
MRRLAGLVVVGAMVVSACTPAIRPTDEAIRRPIILGADRLQLAAALESFGGCGEVLDYFQDSANEMGAAFAWGGGATWFAEGAPMLSRRDAAIAESTAGAAVGGDQSAAASPPAPQAGVDFSETNVQEAGVDEPDVVKTNGRLIVAVARNTLYVVDPTGDAPVLRGSLPLGDANSYGGEVFLTDERVLLLSNGWREPEVQPSRTAPGASAGADIAIMPVGQPIAIVTAIDISDPAAPRVQQRLELDGEYVTARLVDGIARIVLRSTPQFQIQPLPGAETEAQVARQVQTAVASTEIGDWLPSVRADDGEERPLVECDAVSRPPEPSGVGTVTVLTVDAGRDLAIAHSASVVADVATVYASPDNLYVATNGWTDPRVLEQQAQDETVEPPFFTTELHKFDISDATVTSYVASGRVRGHLLNQWSLSEHEGHLRAATTEFPEWMPSGPAGAPAQSQSFVTVLNQQGDALTQVGQVGGLGVDERIYAVRYFGDTGYVVTFRQTDPLYVLDLSEPSGPRVTGELKILGYSAYLHPVGDGLLLGIGQDATDEGQRLGTQLSLFDVSDPANPTRIHQAALGAGDSSVEYDHRAFLWWPAEALTVIPVQIYDGRGFAEPAIVDEPADDDRGGDDAVAPGSPGSPGSPPAFQPFAGVVGFGVDEAAGFAERGRISHAGRSAAEPYAMPVSRSLVIGDALYTLSELGLLASDLDTFTDRGWVAF